MTSGLWIERAGIDGQPAVGDGGEERGDDQHERGERSTAQVELSLTSSVEEAPHWRYRLAGCTIEQGPLRVDAGGLCGPVASRLNAALRLGRLFGPVGRLVSHSVEIRQDETSRLS